MLFSRTGKWPLVALAAVFLLLRFVHPAADYPSNIRWDDGIATDEGWYVSSAINQHLWGTRLLTGDMNIPVLMPLWSAIASAAFALSGFGIVTLRVTAGLFFLLCGVLISLLLRRYGARDGIPLFMCLLAINPWSFAFSRSGFLEFPMLSLVLITILLVAGRIDGQSVSSRFDWVTMVLAGIVFSGAILLKTTAVALAPVVICVVFLRAQRNISKTLLVSLVLVVGAALIGCPYWWLVLRPNAADINFYLSVVKNTLRFHPHGFAADASRPFRYGLGSDHLLFSLALMILPLSLLPTRLRLLWREPLYVIAAVWITSFLCFMIKHNNDPSRYYAIIIPALLLLAVVLARNEVWSIMRTRNIFAVLLLIDLAVNGVQVSYAMLRPVYSFRNATAAIGAVVRHEPGHSQVILADNAHEIALSTGLQPVNLLFHSASITAQMRNYRPGWWIQFAPIEDGRCFHEVLSRAYTAEYRGQWPIFYPGEHLILWKLTPIVDAHLPAELTEEQTAACAPPVYH